VDGAGDEGLIESRLLDSMTRNLTGLGLHTTDTVRLLRKHTMDRREWLGLVGSGVGLSLAGEACAADGHAEAKPGDPGLMAPVHEVHAHFCGIHIAKANPKFQLVAQHYCMSRSEEMHQCLLYDSTEKNAKLLGVEYIISDRLYRELPDEEKKYWHPHTYEVLAGGLIAPSMKREDELSFMKALLTTWGKTWHTWPDPRTPIPLGTPLLMWSIGRDEMADKDVIAARDKQFNVSSAEISRERCQALGLQAPKVSHPKSMDDAGRQWTDEGEDKPARRE
jgi:uncharacterized protein DUF1264